MEFNKEIKVGCLVRPRNHCLDPANNRVYLVGAIVEADAYINKECPVGRQGYATLIGWNEPGYGGEQRTFMLQHLELISAI